MTISWGEELWDQYENIATHTYKGVEFLERLGHFLRDRSSVENEYAAKLRRLVKSYQLKKKEEDELQFSTCRAFRDMLLEVGYIAGQHEVIAENLSSVVVREVQNLVRELKDERKKSLQEGQRLQTTLTNQLGCLERSKKAYEKAWREAEKAHETFQKADADLNLSRAEVEKHRMNNSIRSHQCEEAKNEYAAQLQRTNELQHQHYHDLMPGVFMNLRTLDDKRIQGYKACMKKYVEVEREVEPIISKCLDGILAASDSIQEDEDSRLVIEKFKSGFAIPGDFPFEDLSAIKSGDSLSQLNGAGGGEERGTGGGGGGGNGTLGESPGGGLVNGVGKSKGGGLTLKGTLSASRLKKRGGIFGIFGSHKNGNASPFPESKEDWNELPPNQRKRKLQQRLEELSSKIQQETATRDGLLKMKDVYTANPAMGDPASIEGQLMESGTRLDRLRKELAHFQSMLDEMNSPSNPAGAGASTLVGGTPDGGGVGGGGSRRTRSGRSGGGGSAASSERHSLSDDGESLSRSASDSSVSNPNPRPASGARMAHRHVAGSSNKSQPSSNGSSNSPESGLGMSRMSLPESEGVVGSGVGGGVAGVVKDPHLAEDETDFYYDDGDGEGGDNEADGGDQLTVLGTCRALYSFDAQSEGSIPMCEGEDLQVIELDQGDGWTRVRRTDQSEEGFVPTSYIEISLRGTC